MPLVKHPAIAAAERPIAPAGACDCHAHVYPKGYRYSPRARYRLEPRELADYRAMADALGITRTVFITPSVYGTDNSSLLPALSACGDRARGIVNLSLDVADEEIARLRDLGVVGVRLPEPAARSMAISDVERWGDRLAFWPGMHLDLLLNDVSEVRMLLPALAASPVPIVIDHLARTRGHSGAGQPAFRDLLALLGRIDHLWVKLSSWYRLSDQPYPHADMEPIARALIAARPDRLLWGTNWPHPAWSGPLPDDAELLGTTLGWFDDGATIARVLSENPLALYGFGKADHRRP